MIDIYGPLEVIQFAASYRQINVSLIAETMDDVSTERLMPSMNPMNSSVWPTLPPTHTFENAPVPDVLIIPGGPGMRGPNLNKTLEYIAKTAPKVKHIITICTGSGLAARAGIMNGRKVRIEKKILNLRSANRAQYRQQPTRYPGQVSSDTGRIRRGSDMRAGLKIIRVTHLSGAPLVSHLDLVRDIPLQGAYWYSFGKRNPGCIPQDLLRASPSYSYLGTSTDKDLQI
jgi:putative intracellular protease/amidase